MVAQVHDDRHVVHPVAHPIAVQSVSRVYEHEDVVVARVHNVHDIDHEPDRGVQAPCSAGGVVCES